LKALVLAREVTLHEREGDLANLRDIVATLRKTLSDRALEVERLKPWIAKLQRMQFGRKSAKIDRKRPAKARYSLFRRGAAASNAIEQSCPQMKLKFTETPARC
jgi:hypothetical protein